MVRITYFFKLEDVLQRRTNETIRYSYKLSISLLSIIFLSSGFILEVENQAFREQKRNGGPEFISQEFLFHDVFYYLIVTLGTIGYGDITPKTVYAKFGIIITIFSILIFIPTLSQKLITVLALTSKYSRISYTKFSKDSKHLLILGSCTVEGYENFLEELYHVDHGIVGYETVIMQNSQSEDLMFLIRNLIRSNNIFYLVGNSLIYKDLERANASGAVCVVLLTNKLAKNPKNEDFSTILQAFSVKKFARMCANRDLRICMQLLLPEMKEMYINSLLNTEEINSKDQVICIEEIKLMLLGKSCLCPGINTIISHLITSNKPSLNSSEVSTDEVKWLDEYLIGIQNEIYRVKLEKEIIEGFKFNKLIKHLFDIGLTVIGVDVLIDGCDPYVCMNPSNYYFSENDHVIYVLCNKSPDSAAINDELRERLKTEEREHSNDYTKYNKMRNKKSENQRKNYQKIKQLKMLKQSIERDSLIKNKANFILNAYPRTNNDLENFSSEILNSHIIICGLVQNMKSILMPLRAASMKSQQFPILIIGKEDHISSDILKDIQYFPDIYYIQGNLIKSKDLHRACIKRAKAVVILSRNMYNDDTQEMVDADTIFIYKAIRNENKNVLIIADLASITTIGFISSNSDMNFLKQGYRLTQQFAVGEIYTSNMLDTLMCQAFYNPYITSIIHQFLLGSAVDNSSSSEVHQRILDMKITNSTLYLLNINEELEKFGHKDLPKKMNYSNIFYTFAEKNIIPIGIFRNSNLFGLNKLEKYVYLCPPKETEVWIEHDKIYVLSYNQEGDDHKSLYKNREVSNFHKNNLKLIQLTNDLATTALSNIKESLDLSKHNLSHHLSIKKITDITRSSLRKELITTHDTLTG
jgi:hypothetical protein